MDAKGLIILLVIITALTGIIFYWYNIQLTRETPILVPVPHKHSVSLGAAIYQKGSDPVANKLPDTNPVSVTNPFETYVNPFGN